MGFLGLLGSLHTRLSSGSKHTQAHVLSCSVADTKTHNLSLTACTGLHQGKYTEYNCRCDAGTAPTRPQQTEADTARLLVGYFTFVFNKCATILFRERT